MEEKQIIITHETLFDIIKREKDRTELQKLDNTFFNDVVDYIKEKKKITSNESLFSSDEKKKVQIQIKNIRRLLKDLYDKREKKIINMALDKSRTKSDVIDISALLKEEKMLFEYLVTLFNKFRAGILDNLLNVSIPAIEKDIENVKEKEVDGKIVKDEIKIDTKIVRFVHAVPKFVGKELEEYGPFEEDDIANLPNEIADVLINKDRVEEIKEKQ